MKRKHRYLKSLILILLLSLFGIVTFEEGRFYGLTDAQLNEITMEAR